MHTSDIDDKPESPSSAAESCCGGRQAAPTPVKREQDACHADKPTQAPAKQSVASDSNRRAQRRGCCSGS